MIEVILETLQMSLVSHHRVAVLREIDVEHYLPILIGPCEADAIANCLNRVEITRPQTHDLIVNMLRALGANLLYIYVNALANNIFYARLVIEVDGREIDIDARPSDAMAIAVRVGVPIFVAEEVMDEAGVVPERDIIQSKGADKDLSAFRDFLSSLDRETPATDAEG